MQSVSVSRTVVSVAAVVAFYVWVNRARTNAEQMSGLETSVSSKRVTRWTMAAIWRSSAPGPVSTGRVTAWWWLFFVGLIVGRVILPMYLNRQINKQVLLIASALSALSSVLHLAAGVLIVLIIKQITAWQSKPGDVPGADHHGDVSPTID